LSGKPGIPPNQIPFPIVMVLNLIVMQQYTVFSIAIFAILVVLLAITAFTTNTMLIAALVGIVPMFVLIQVYGILTSKEEVPPADFEDWYEKK
jgi:ABC-type multidrug transport system permease subunit